MKRRMNLFVPPTEAKLPPVVRSAQHPNPKYRKSKPQEYGTVDKHGNYHGPKGGGIPTAPWQDTEAPERAREAAHQRWLKKQRG